MTAAANTPAAVAGSALACFAVEGSGTRLYYLQAASHINEIAWANKSAWQQYVVAVYGNEIVGAVDNWPLNGPNLINDFFNMASLPTPIMPAGYIIQISLQNDTNNNITGAAYMIISDQGVVTANNTVSLTSISAASVAPIIAFELNLVGPVNGESAVLSSGAGTITYRVPGVLSVQNAEPPCAESGFVTAEKANSFYSELSASPSSLFIQSFNVSTERPMIRKEGKTRPSFIVPSAPLSVIK
jgi:hypothetical protein